MEEMLGNVPGARQIFERWMAFEPDHHGWMAYIKVKLSYQQGSHIQHAHSWNLLLLFTSTLRIQIVWHCMVDVYKTEFCADCKIKRYEEMG